MEDEIRNNLAKKIATLTTRIETKTAELTIATTQGGRKTRQRNIDKLKAELEEAQNTWKNLEVEAHDQPSSPLSECSEEAENGGTGSRASTLMSDMLTTHTDPRANVPAPVLQAQVVTGDCTPTQERTPTQEHIGRTEYDRFPEEPNQPPIEESEDTLSARVTKADRATRSLTTESAPTTVSQAILETERRASMIIADLDRAISGSPPHPLQNSEHPSRDRMGKHINTAKSIWKPVLPKPPSPVGMVDEGPKHSRSAGADGQTGEDPDVPRGYELVLPKPASPVRMVDEGPQSTADGQTVGEGPEHPVPTKDASDIVKGVEHHTDNGVADRGTAAEAPPSELNFNVSEDEMKPAPVDQVQQTPLGAIAPPTVPTTMVDPGLEEIYALARAKGIEFLHVFPQVKTEETKTEMPGQKVNLKQHDGQEMTSSEGQSGANTAGKRSRDPDSSGDKGEEKKTKRSKSQKSSGTKGKGPSQSSRKKAENDGAYYDDDFIVQDDVVDPDAEYEDVDDSGEEDAKDKPITKPKWKPKKSYSWRNKARKAMTQDWQKRGREAWEKWCLDPAQNPIPANIRSKARAVSEFCPELATTCPDLSLHILTSELGTTRCLTHSFSRDWSQNDQVGCIKGYQATGIPHQAVTAKEQPEEGFLHCGCRIDTALMELYFYKTGKISCEKTGPDGMPAENPIVESWCGMRLTPRQRVLIFKQIAEEMAWSLDCIWQRKMNSEGQWIVPISAVERQKIHMARQTKRLEWLEAREEAQKAQMDIDS